MCKEDEWDLLSCSQRYCGKERNQCGSQDTRLQTQLCDKKPDTSVKRKRTVSKWNKVSEVGNRNNWRGRIRNTTIRNRFHWKNPSCIWWRQNYCHDMALGMDNVKETKWNYIQKEEEEKEYKERNWWI